MARRVFAFMIVLLAGALAAPPPAGAQRLWFGHRRPPPPVNSPAFARRPPPPGRPGYLETIGYIDDGLKYIDPQSGFFVSADGRMCFVGVLNVQRTVFEIKRFPWCVAPTALAAIDAIENDVTYVPQLRLWCRHAAPQCFQERGEFYRRSDSVAVEIIPSQRERAAIAYLAYLMGGWVPAEPPWQD
ncbi:MAG TPA: hypothetical protein VE993_11935 [Stellaceae bacterium]|nr:hypothetical protein [Stellaceae bacterium]